MNTFRSKNATMIISVGVLALAIALFLDVLLTAGALGSSNVLLGIAFLLVVALAIVLLVLYARTVGHAVPAAGSRREAAEVQATAATLEDSAAPSAEIISEAAGELRTTVDAIQEELEEILEDEAPADKEHMQTLYDETGRLKKIIDSMEQLSRIPELARIEGKEAVAVEPLLREIIESARGSASGKEVAFNIECEPGLVMKVDPECIRYVIGNITDNAVRAIRNAGSVTIAARREGGSVVLSVRDTGIGIRRAQLPHIYERFFRGTGSGIGMGLSIVKELIDACKGTIEVQTAANKGTTFVITLPGA